MLDFTCRIGTTTLKLLSEADETEVVRCIKELPLEFQAVTPFLFSLQLPQRTYDLTTDDWQIEGLKRASDGLSSVLIALQIHPIIRYQTQSHLCRELAEKVSLTLRNESLANLEWRQAAPFDINSLLIVVDRRYDLVTPIVNSWIYYPLIHEQFEIKNNLINFENIPNRQARDPREMMISTENDSFFDENYAKNYGELGTVIKEAVEGLKMHTKSKHKVETMDDMKRFIEEYPETKRYARNLHNHVYLMTELTRIVKEYDIMLLSECEQELACDLISHSEVVKKLRQLVSRPTIRPSDALRLVSLYTVCSQDTSALSGLVKLLNSRGDVSKSDVDFIAHLKRFSSSKTRNSLVRQVNRMIIQVKGVDNVLTQYRPNIAKVIEEVRRDNKLKESEFAFCGERYRGEPPRRIIVFFVGGVTYDEAMEVDTINKSSAGLRVVIGGTSILSFKTFKEEIS